MEGQPEWRGAGRGGARSSKARRGGVGWGGRYGAEGQGGAGRSGRQGEAGKWDREGRPGRDELPDGVEGPGAQQPGELSRHSLASRHRP